MSLASSVVLQITATLSKLIGTGTGTVTSPVTYKPTLADGTGAGQVAKVWTSKDRALAASTGEDLDLAGVLLDGFGDAFDPAKLKGIAIVAADTNVNDVVVGNAASNGFVGPFGAATHTIAVKPGGCVFMFAPQAAGLGTVVAGTADLLHVLNGGAGTTVSYTIILFGV
jgi:hypothetical protein